MGAQDTLQRPLDARAMAVTNLPAPAAPGAGAAVRNEIELVDVIVRRFRESGGPTDLLLGAVPDGTFLKRSGAGVVGVASAASDHLEETLTNNTGGDVNPGDLVVVSAPSAFNFLTDAAGPLGLVGVAAEAIANAASGKVATHGKQAVKFDGTGGGGALTLVENQLVYLASTAVTLGVRGLATNVPPTGDYIAPIGIIKDASAYTGAQGDTAIVDLTPFPLEANVVGPSTGGGSLSIPASVKVQTADGNPVTAFAFPIEQGKSYKVHAHATCLGEAIADTGQFEAVAGYSFPTGGAATQTGGDATQVDLVSLADNQNIGIVLTNDGAGNVNVNVVGDAGITFDWSVRVEVLVSTPGAVAA